MRVKALDEAFRLGMDEASCRLIEEVLKSDTFLSGLFACVLAVTCCPLVLCAASDAGFFNLPFAQARMAGTSSSSPCLLD